MYIRTADKNLFKDIRAVWYALPRSGEQKIPAKSALHPRMLASYLANIGISEHVGGGQLVFRLLGTNSREFWGEELTGSTYEELANQLPEGVMMPPEILEAIFQQPCGIESVREAEDKEGHTWRADMLSLPLADNNGEAKYLLYGYRVYSVGDGPITAGWMPGFADLTTARLISMGFVDIGSGVPT